MVFPLCCRRGGRQSDAPPEKDKHRYQYGNHIRYYGYHGGYGNRWEGRVGAEEDPRLRLLEADWFRDKLVLDVGCGAGHMTLAIARRFNPAHILGVELDDKLVHAAQQNVRHFLSHDLMEVERRRRCSSASCREEGGEMDKAFQKVRLLSFPLSLRVSRGPLSAPPLLAAPPPFGRFPDNVTIVQVSPPVSRLSSKQDSYQATFTSHRETMCQSGRRGQGRGSMMSSCVWV